MNITFVIITCGISLFISSVVIFTVRTMDKKNRTLATIKNTIDRYGNELVQKHNVFKQEMAETEMAISQKSNEVKSLIQTLTSQITELNTYSGDFGKLSSAMASYRNALEGLARLTLDADAKTDQLASDVEHLESVKKDIADFREDMAKSNAQLRGELEQAATELREEKERLGEFERDVTERITAAVREADSGADSFMQTIQNGSREALDDFNEKIGSESDALFLKVNGFLAKLENVFSTAHEVTDMFKDNAITVLSQICDGAADQVMISHELEALREQKNKLTAQIVELDEQIGEQVAVFESEKRKLEGIRSETERLEQEREQVRQAFEREKTYASPSVSEHPSFEIKDIDYTVPDEPEPSSEENAENDEPVSEYEPESEPKAETETEDIEEADHEPEPETGTEDIEEANREPEPKEQEKDADVSEKTEDIENVNDSHRKVEYYGEEEEVVFDD